MLIPGAAGTGHTCGCVGCALVPSQAAVECIVAAAGKGNAACRTCLAGRSAADGDAMSVSRFAGRLTGGTAALAPVVQPCTCPGAPAGGLLGACGMAG